MAGQDTRDGPSGGGISETNGIGSIINGGDDSSSAVGAHESVSPGLSTVNSVKSHKTIDSAGSYTANGKIRLEYRDPITNRYIFLYYDY